MIDLNRNKDSIEKRSQKRDTKIYQSKKPLLNNMLEGVPVYVKDAAGVHQYVKIQNHLYRTKLELDNSESASTTGNSGSINIGGIILKWATITSSIDTPQVHNFITPFGSGCYGVWVNRQIGEQSMPMGAMTITRSGFTIDRNNAISDEDFNYIAIGR